MSACEGASQLNMTAWYLFTIITEYINGQGHADITIIS